MAAPEARTPQCAKPLSIFYAGSEASFYSSAGATERAVELAWSLKSLFTSSWVTRVEALTTKTTSRSRVFLLSMGVRSYSYL